MSPKEIQKRNDKAKNLRVLQSEDGQFFVESQKGRVLYRVLLGDEGNRCTCGDFSTGIRRDKDHHCKHILAVINAIPTKAVEDAHFCEKPVPKLDERWITTIENKEFVRFPGLLDLGHQKGITSIEVEIVQMPTKDNGNFAVCRATVMSKIGETFIDVGDALGVHYVLKGGVQKSDDRLRMTVQLIDAISGSYIWSERYDRQLKDIFALQDEITINIMNNMVAELAEGEQTRRWTKSGVTNLQALEKHYQAQGFFCLHTKENYEKARPLFEQAIALDPKFVWPYVYLGYVHSALSRWNKSPDKSLQTALELAQKALDIDDTHDGPHSLLASIYRKKLQHDKALAEVEKAIDLYPNSSDSYMMLSLTVGEMLGHGVGPQQHIEKSIKGL
jgi:hypothetical protein